MSNIRLEPLGQTVEVARGAALRDALFAHGVEFPCGGRGRCKRCRVRVLTGSLAETAADQRELSREELDAGWRLACHAEASGDLTLEVAQWDAAILADNSAFEFTPREGLAIAVDLGTTTVVAQLVDLATGHVAAVRPALNSQAVHGSDIMSRIQYALREDGARRLEELIRSEIARLVRELIEVSGRPEECVREVVVVGNTAMHHLFCGIDVEPLAHVPFEPVRDGLETLRLDGVGAPVRFLPCLGGFVGSDILAGILASKIMESDRLLGLIDLGTNGEIVFGNRDRIVCASTAAGPAFEGGRISMGMRAATGAVSEVSVTDAGLRCHVLGGGAPRGICGSGLVDAAAAGLDLGAIQPNGRLRSAPFELASPVRLTQQDIRELQLAKAAIAAGIRIVLRRLGARREEVDRLYLAGAFGNYINRGNARRIGLIDFPEEQVEAAGNTALLGAKLALFAEDLEFTGVRAKTEHISLASDAYFQEIFVEQMAFPA